jgi:hypothetical protein
VIYQPSRQTRRREETAHAAAKYNFDNDVGEWLDELGGAENAERYLSDLTDRCTKAGEANKACYHRKIAAEMRKIINSRASGMVRTRRNA